MNKFLVCGSLVLVLMGCEFGNSPQDLTKAINATSEIVNSQELRAAGEEVLTGGKEIVANGKEAAKNIGSGAQKVLSGGKVIFSETEQILNELKLESGDNQPDSGDTVWLREQDQGCEVSETCFSWRPDEDSPWQLLQGQIGNLDDLPAQIDNWQVRLSSLSDLLEAWEVAEVIKTDGQ